MKSKVLLLLKNIILAGKSRKLIFIVSNSYFVQMWLWFTEENEELNISGIHWDNQLC